MSKVTRFPHGVGVGGGRTGATVASTLCYLPLSFDPTSASQVLVGTLPAGATPLDVLSFGGTTGGTNPTVDIGTLADDDGYANELDADAAGTSASAGAKQGVLLNVRVTVPTAVYGKVGASAGTGGTFKGGIIFIMSDS